jgi:hypothetical protein
MATKENGNMYQIRVAGLSTLLNENRAEHEGQLPEILAVEQEQVQQEFGAPLQEPQTQLA